MYDKLMYKVKRKDNKILYRVQDLTKNDNVDEIHFKEKLTPKGEKRLQSQVKVLHENEYKALIEKLEQLNRKVDSLNREINKKKSKIKTLQNKIAEHDREDIDKKFNILQEHSNETRALEKQHQTELDELKETHKNELHDIDKNHKELLKKIRSHYTDKVDSLNDKLLSEVQANQKTSEKLRGEIIDLQQAHYKELETIQQAHSNELQDIEKQHTYDINQLKDSLAEIKQAHLVEIHEIEQRHNDEVEQIRAKFIKLLANEHAQDLSDLKECESVPSILKPLLRGHIKKLDEFKKRKYMNTPQKIVETYEIEQTAKNST